MYVEQVAMETYAAFDCKLACWLTWHFRLRYAKAPKASTRIGVRIIGKSPCKKKITMLTFCFFNSKLDRRLLDVTWPEEKGSFRDVAASEGKVN